MMTSNCTVLDQHLENIHGDPDSIQEEILLEVGIFSVRKLVPTCFNTRRVSEFQNTLKSYH